MTPRPGSYNPDDVRRRLRTLGNEPEIAFDRISLEWVDELETLRSAAVLVPLTEIDGRLSAVFTKRPETMPEHSGEVSFPGGRLDEDDENLCETALRETHEEIELRPEDVDLYGSLLRMPTVTGYDVTVFVGEFDQPYHLVANPREIDEIFTVSLDELADPARHRIEERSWEGESFDLHFYDYESHVIWGATGYMVYVLLNFLTPDEE